MKIQNIGFVLALGLGLAIAGGASADPEDVGHRIEERLDPPESAAVAEVPPGLDEHIQQQLHSCTPWG